MNRTDTPSMPTPPARRAKPKPIPTPLEHAARQLTDNAKLIHHGGLPGYFIPLDRFEALRSAVIRKEG